MKLQYHQRFFLAGFATLSLISTLQLPSACEPAQKSSRSVQDYFYKLPEDLFEVSRKQLLSKRPGYSAIVDNKNGFIHTWGDGAQPEYDIALFRGKAYDEIIVYQDENDVFDRSLHIYRSTNDGSLIDVTKSELPKPFSRDFRYKLPRVGKTIRVSNAKGKTAYSLTWVNDKFVLEPAR